VIAAVDPNVAALAAFLDKSVASIGADGALIAGVNLKPHTLEVSIPERVGQEEADRFRADSLSPTCLVADADAKFGGTGCDIDVHEAAVADAFAIDIDGEPGIIATAAGDVAVEVGLHALERLRHRWVATAGEFDGEIVVEAAEAREIVAAYGSQRALRADKHVHRPFHPARARGSTNLSVLEG